MYERCGAPRVDDGLMSTKHLLTHSSAQISTAPIDLNLNNNSSSNNNNNNIDGTGTPSLEPESNRKEHKADVEVTTPPGSARQSQQAYASLAASEKETTTTTTRTTITTNTYQTLTTNQISENIRSLLERVPAAAAAAATIHQQQATRLSTTSSATVSSSASGSPPSSLELPTSQAYQLRALTGKKLGDAQEQHHPRYQRLDVNTLSLSLIEETLKYFVSCRHRLSQITKTFDDSNALIMLLQEKEEDLEVVGQLGQDLLRRYNELKQAYEAQSQELAKFREELARCREDNQQLKYDLASNRSLLDTFKEEEEHLLEQQNSSLRVCTQCQSTTSAPDDDGQSFSLRSQADRSLSYLDSELYRQMCELKDELMEVRERELRQKLVDQDRSLQLEMQLRDTEMRQNDLEGENETLRDQQRELQQVIDTQSRRFDELLRIFSEYQHEQSRLQQLTSGHNISTLDYPTESWPSPDSQLDSLLFLDQSQYQHDTQLHRDTNHRNHRSTCPTTTAVSAHEQQQRQQRQQQQQQQNQQIVRPIVRTSSSNNIVTSTSLHEELLESMHKEARAQFGLHESYSDDDHDDDAHDYQAQATSERSGQDSGLQTRNISSSTTPVGSCLDTDSELSSPGPVGLIDPNNNTISKPQSAPNSRINCLGLSTFTLTTLLLLCLSATFNSSTNSNLAQKLQQINLNQ